MHPIEVWEPLYHVLPDGLQRAACVADAVSGDPVSDSVGDAALQKLPPGISSAIAEYNKALDLGLRQDYVAHLNRGMAYEKLGKFYEAEADYRQAIALAPEWNMAKSKLERVLIKIN